MITRDSKFVPIKDIDVSIYTVPTDFPESDGTLEWNSTTLVPVQASAGNKKGLGHTYADTATANPVHHLLAKAVEGRDAMAISACWNAMVCRTRNLGRAGIVSMAISAVDSALWDLKARLLDIPLVTLLGRVRESVAIYRSGGFTSYSEKQKQLSARAQQNSLPVNGELRPGMGIELKQADAQCFAA